jgi:flavin-dependent dehydrogenase
MDTGQLAGEVAAQALAEDDVSAARLARYQVAWQREIGEELTDSLRIQRRLFARPGLVDRVIRAAAADPALCRLFAAVALGEESLRRRKLEMAARLLLALARPRRRRPGPARRASVRGTTSGEAARSV